MPLTAMVAAPLALLFAGLGLRLSQLRRSKGIGPGMTGDAAFTRLQRAHANAAEHIPFVLVLSLLGEMAGTSRHTVLALGGLFVLARLAHASGIVVRSRHPLHFAGAAVTYFVEIAWGGLLLLPALRPNG